MEGISRNFDRTGPTILRLSALAGAAALAACGGGGDMASREAAAAAHVSAPIACAELAGLSLPQATITAAEEIPAGSYTPPGSGPLNDLPAFCRVALTVEPQVNIEVWLPRDTWNGRYRGEGGGGYAGRISYGGLANGIRAGYATASTDTGHPPSGGSFALNPDGTLNHQLILDFASRSLHEMVLKAKALIKAHYGEGPQYSYWNGCSTGGRQGLMAVQRFPQEYDGLVIGAPAINWDRFITAELWPQVVMHEDLGGPIAPAKLAAVTSAAVQACDADDGVPDGIINDPRKCDYDPASAVCTPTSDPATCLTPQEAEAVRKIWDGPRDTSGQRLWFGLERGAPLGGLAGQNPFSIAVDHFRYWIKQDPAFDWRTVTQASFESDFRLSQRKFNEVIGTDEDNLQRFRKLGGKMIIWHGESDQLIPPRGTLNYFDRVLTGNGGSKHVGDMARLFMAPGVGHCGGLAPSPTGLFDAVVDWVENGNAPDMILASDGTRTRRLCPYPQTAKWTGSGSTDDAASYVCVDGGHDVRDFRVQGPGSN